MSPVPEHLDPPNARRSRSGIDGGQTERRRQRRDLAISRKDLDEAGLVFDQEGAHTDRIVAAVVGLPANPPQPLDRGPGVGGPRTIENCQFYACGGTCSEYEPPIR